MYPVILMKVLLLLLQVYDIGVESPMMDPDFQDSSSNDKEDEEILLVMRMMKLLASLNVPSKGSWNKCCINALEESFEW
jgi:hypothetical protein